jgi:hypothetical protein
MHLLLCSRALRHHKRRRALLLFTTPPCSRCLSPPSNFKPPSQPNLPAANTSSHCGTTHFTARASVDCHHHQPSLSSPSASASAVVPGTKASSSASLALSATATRCCTATCTASRCRWGIYIADALLLLQFRGCHLICPLLCALHGQNQNQNRLAVICKQIRGDQRSTSSVNVKLVNVNASARGH